MKKSERKHAGRKTAGAVLVVDKPQGPTSHDVVAQVRRALRTKQVGHCGTLDPMATGVLVLAIGEATKLVPWLTADDKTYEAVIRLGVATDSLDAEGTETEWISPSEALVRALSHGEADVVPDSATAAGDTTHEARFAYFAHALDAERQRTQQVPPAFSAIRVNGERAHALARRGETPELAPRACAVRRLDVVGFGLTPHAFVRVVLEASKGYFVRSLARDFASALGTVGHLTQLRRLRSGVFTLAEAAPLLVEEREDRATRLGDSLIPMAEAAARALPASVIASEGVRAARFGQRISPAFIQEPHACPSAWFDAAGALIAIGEVEADGGGRVLRGFDEAPST